MSCPSCGQTESTVSCVECSAPTVNCPNPNKCVDVTSTDCVIYVGEDAQCHDTEPLLENGDNLSVGLKKVIDYFCEHTHIEEAKSAGGIEILSVGDGMTESFISVIDYFSNALSQGGGGSGGAGGLLNKTHAEMVAMQGAGTFVPGQWYKITDFATMYEQPDYTGTTLANIVAVTTPIVKTSAIEPIHIQAITATKLNPFAFQNEYAKDIIKYELAYTTPITATPTKGRITFRQDEYGNTTFYDHRTVLFKRYKDLDNIFSSVYDLTYGSSEFLTFNALGVGSAQVYNNFIPKTILYNGFDLPNVVFRGNAFDNTFGSYFGNNTYIGNCTNNKVGSAYANAHFTVFVGNTISVMIRNVIRKNFQYNIIKYILSDSTINAVFTNNTVYSLTTSTITANLFANNLIDTFQGNTINTTLNFTNNEMQTFNANTVLNLFQNNVFSLSIANCNFNFAAENNRGLALQYVNTSSSVVKKLQFNNFDCYVTGTVGTPIDLSSATHVYNSYTCKIYKNANGDVKVSYYNALDSEVTALITA
jgi:hypothetical protein